MDWQAILNWGAPVVAAIMAAYTRHVQKQLDEQEARHDLLQGHFTQFQIKAAQEFVTHARLTDVMSDIRGTLHRIEEKLDGKADK